MIFRVSHADMFRSWLEDDDSDVGWLLNALSSDEPTPAMLKGTAFHKALELAPDGDFDELSANGYTFIFDGDFSMPRPQIREIRHAKNYGGISISGQVDAVSGGLVVDYKSTAHFDAEKYQRGYAWRFYLDIFRANLFRWNIFEMSETDELMTYRVTALHVMEQFRYPELEQDCRALAHKLRDFARQYLTPHLSGDAA